MPEPSPSDSRLAQLWFERRTYASDQIDVERLASSLRDESVSVILPARNEEATVGAIVAALWSHPIGSVLGEIIVVDSASTDNTAMEAAASGAHVVTVPSTGRDDGKGAALHTGLAAMRGSIGVFLDADIVDFDPTFVPRLLEPLAREPDVAFVKGFYDRPWTGSDEGAVGGRVTELVARPLLHERVPRLAAVAQPLAGECAFRRDALAPLPFVSGYGVDIGLLIDVVGRFGLDAIGQVDLGVRKHRHQSLDALTRMSLQVRAALDLCLTDASAIEQRRAVVSRTASGDVELTEETVLTRLLPPLATA